MSQSVHVACLERAENVDTGDLFQTPLLATPYPHPKPLAQIQLAPDFCLHPRRKLSRSVYSFIYTNKLSCVPWLSQSRRTIPSASRLFRIRLGLEARWNPLPNDAKSFVLIFSPFLSSLICTNPCHSFLWFSWPHLFLVFQMPGKTPRILFFLDS